ncbi:MAG: phosphate ABC transporter permease PstA [Akkermansiaceae bacterium]|nr:phosphate ABC transporter permease PstA [Akkermansiaceae bacterium]
MNNPNILKRKKTLLRKLSNIAVNCFCLLSISLALWAMYRILYTVWQHGSDALTWEFLTEPSKPYGEPHAGIANALLGTLYMTFGAACMAILPAVAAGVWLAEFGKTGKLATALRFCGNVLMGVPSIIIGLFVYVLIVIPAGHFSGWAGSVALAIIMFPVIMRTTEDSLNMVPNTLRESALALGMTRLRATLCIVARSAKNGLITGILLSLARVSGETAPLLFTALFADTYPKHFFEQPTASVPVLINEYTNNSPFESMHHMGWGAALVIAMGILLINILTRIIFHENKH